MSTDKKIIFTCDHCRKEREGWLPFITDGGEKICPRCIQKNPNNYPEFWQVCVKRSWSGIPEDPSEPGHYRLWVDEKVRLEDRFYQDKNLSFDERQKILDRISLLERKMLDHQDQLKLRSEQVYRSIYGVK